MSNFINLDNLSSFFSLTCDLSIVLRFSTISDYSTYSFIFYFITIHFNFYYFLLCTGFGFFFLSFQLYNRLFIWEPTEILLWALIPFSYGLWTMLGIPQRLYRAEQWSTFVSRTIWISFMISSIICCCQIKSVQGWHSGSEGWPLGLNLSPKIYIKVKKLKWFHKDVLWHPHMCDVSCMDRPKHFRLFWLML